MYDFKNIKWKKNNTVTVRYIYIDNKNCKIYKKYKSDCYVKKLKNIYDKINKFDFVPRMEFYEDENIIVEDYFKNKLTISNKPFDYIYQLLRFDKILKENNMYYNDFKLEHFYVKYGKIKMIDWEKLTIGAPAERGCSNNNIIQFILYYSLDIIIRFILITILIIINLKN